MKCRQTTNALRDSILKRYGLELHDTGLRLIQSLIRPQQVYSKFLYIYHI